MKLLEREQQIDQLTSDIFYEMLAEAISDPVPQRREGYGPVETSFGAPSFSAMSMPLKQRELVDFNRGIRTDLLSIEQYLEEVIGSIMANEAQFIDQLLEPVRQNPLDMLQLLQNSDLGSYEHFENPSLKQPVLPLDLYLDIERKKEERDARDGTEPTEELAELEHIHRKMVFDAINEALNKYRPYGQEGVPMPWAQTTRQLCSNDILNFEKVFNGIKDTLFNWGQTLAGSMPREEFVYESHFSEEMFAEVREKRLSALLSSEVCSGEKNWLSYLFEESQVKIDITDMILEDMIHEICLLVNAKEEQNEKGEAGESIFRNLPPEFIELLES